MHRFRTGAAYSWKSSLGVWLALIISLIFSPAGAVQAASPHLQDQGSSAIIRLSDLDEEDIVARQVFDQFEIHFKLAEGLKFEKAVLNLHFEHSSLLLADSSDLTIGLNNEPLINLVLDKDNIGPVLLPIPIPGGILLQGENSLLFRFNLRLDNTGCKDANSPDLWAKVYSDTSIEITYTDEKVIPELNRYPAPFNSLSSLAGSPQLAFVLPEDPVSAELTAAGRIAASLGQVSGWQKPPVLVLTPNEITPQLAESYHLIAINLADRNRLAQGATDGLTETVSPFNPSRLMLTVSAANESILDQVVDMISTRSAFSALLGTHQPPEATNPLPYIEIPESRKFVDLGIPDWRVRGIGSHDLYYPIFVPYDWKTTSEAYIEIYFSHALNLERQHSLLSVYINGNKVSDIALTNFNAREGRLLVKLSPRQVHQGRNWLHLRIALHINREDCRFRYLEQAWLAVSNSDSNINLAHVTSQAPLDLQYLPAAFIIPPDLSNDIFVLPDSPTSAEMTAFIRLAAKLGTYGQADGLRPMAMTALEFKDRQPSLSASSTQYRYIVIGSPGSNSILKEYDEKLPQSLHLASGAIVPENGRDLLTDEITAVGKTVPEAGYLQLLAAPWSSRSVMVVIAAFDIDGLFRVVDATPSAYERFNLQGNVAVITQDAILDLRLGGIVNYPLSAGARSVVAIVFIFAFLLVSLIGWVTYQHKLAVEEEELLSKDEEL